LIAAFKSRDKACPFLQIHSLSESFKSLFLSPQTLQICELGKKYTITKEKWELVSSHTARRTGATNMYKAGIPTLAIMKVTGHTSESSFLKYINISKEENARMLAEHPYFKR
jgi:integrase